MKRAEQRVFVVSGKTAEGKELEISGTHFPLLEVALDDERILPESIVITCVTGKKKLARFERVK